MGITGYVVVILLALAVVAAGLELRRLRTIREGGVHVAFRTHGQAGGSDARGWRLGIGHYHGETFLWYRVLGVTTRPDRVIPRSGLQIADRREPSAAEAYAMPGEAVVLTCGVEAVTLELAMSTDTLTGFLSWLESSPPGRGFRRAV